MRQVIAVRIEKEFGADCELWERTSSNMLAHGEVVGGPSLPEHGGGGDATTW